MERDARNYFSHEFRKSNWRSFTEIYFQATHHTVPSVKRRRFKLKLLCETGRIGPVLLTDFNSERRWTSMAFTIHRFFLLKMILFKVEACFRSSVFIKANNFLLSLPFISPFMKAAALFKPQQNNSWTTRKTKIPSYPWKFHFYFKLWKREIQKEQKEEEKESTLKTGIDVCNLVEWFLYYNNARGYNLTISFYNSESFL